MQYMLLIYLEENAPTEAQREQCYAESAQFAQQLNASGQYLVSSPLHPTSTATSLRIRDGKRVVTDGPFAETRAQLGGFFLIDCQSKDEALTIAAECPVASWATIAVREVGPCYE